MVMFPNLLTDISNIKTAYHYIYINQCVNFKYFPFKRPLYLGISQ